MDLVYVRQQIHELECEMLAVYAATIRAMGHVGAEALGIDEDYAQALQRLNDRRIMLLKENLGAAPVMQIRRSAALLAALEHAAEAGTEDIMLAARARVGER